MFGEYFEEIIIFFTKKCFQLVNCDCWHSNNFSILLIIFSNGHFIESLKELFKLIDNKIMRKHKPLIIIPQLIHSLNKQIRLISFDNILNLRLHIILNKLSNIYSYVLINLCSLVNCRSGVSKVVNVTIGIIK